MHDYQFRTISAAWENARFPVDYEPEPEPTLADASPDELIRELELRQQDPDFRLSSGEWVRLSRLLSADTARMREACEAEA